MSEDYRSMWENLGLDLGAHDALLEVLGKGYQDIYLAQQNRPEGMGYFDFVMSEVHGLRIKELMDEKEAGRKVIGSFCVFVPMESMPVEKALEEKNIPTLRIDTDYSMEEMGQLKTRVEAFVELIKLNQP